MLTMGIQRQLQKFRQLLTARAHCHVTFVRCLLQILSTMARMLGKASRKQWLLRSRISNKQEFPLQGF
ncbi:hypothetical protein SYN60AY4M2_12570 [Synechococcus sp. 60AY4M2]|nr:hypothetical protein SYN60AY4M2_12570 [Synechococcus sp. 60AY4M2]PIL02415.1 hypothetical protein SYN65AY640_03970 [Synechococcus sp. 65AY640]